MHCPFYCMQQSAMTFKGRAMLKVIPIEAYFTDIMLLVILLLHTEHNQISGPALGFTPVNKSLICRTQAGNTPLMKKKICCSPCGFGT